MLHGYSHKPQSCCCNGILSHGREFSCFSTWQAVIYPLGRLRSRHVLPRCPTVCRLHPGRDELVQYVSSLPSTIVASVAYLDSLPTALLKATDRPCDHEFGGIGGGNSSSNNTRGACQRRPSYSRFRLPSGRARNGRLETMWSSCRSLEIQVRYLTSMSAWWAPLVVIVSVCGLTQSVCACSVSTVSTCYAAAATWWSMACLFRTV